MARNAISYEGRLINTEKTPIEFGKYKADGQTVLKVTIAEQHQAKNKNAGKFQDKTKGAEDWVDTETSWHRVTIFGDLAEELAADEEFNHGAILVVEKASYVEESAWTTKDGVQRAGRPETISADDASVSVKEWNGRIFGAYEENKGALWDGIDEIPLLKTKGSTSAPRREYSDNEGL